MSIVAGVDFGTGGVRVTIADAADGALGSASAPLAVRTNPADPLEATQRHADHLVALERAFADALRRSGVDGRSVGALAIATTGSTVLPIDAHFQPIGDYYLWSDHRAWREAAEITAAAQAAALPAIRFCGGRYSAEWGWAKLLHWLRHNPGLRDRFHTAVEHCDYIVATLCCIADLDALPRSICAMGHKWLWNAELGGFPPEDFLASVDPLLAGMRDRMAGRYQTSNMMAGRLSGEWARRLGIAEGIPVPTGALDAHWDAIGSGCRRGDIVNVVGTSSCIMALSDSADPIDGIPGVVPGSIHPAYAGIEAGLASVGGTFAAIAARANRPLDTLMAETGAYKAGQTGLVRLLWDNGDRSVLMNPALGGITMGWRNHHVPADELFAAMEGAAFQTRIIAERLGAHGVPLDRIINGGGIPQRNIMLNRTYASVLGVPVLVPRFEVTGLGSAMFAMVVAGAVDSIETAQGALCTDYQVVEPDTEAVRQYEVGFEEFRHFYFSLPSMLARARPQG